MDGSSVEMTGVEKRLGSTRALAGVSLEIDRGLTVVLGPAGAGKTTLLRLVATVSVPDRGRLRVLGYDPRRGVGRTAVRRRLGYVPQPPPCWPRATAFQFVDYVAVLKGMADRRARHLEVHRALEQVGLGDATGTRVRALGAPMRLRVSLARALVGEPDLLVLDDLAGTLGPEERLDLHDQVVEAALDRTVLLSSRRPDVAAGAGRVIVVRDGLARFEGSPYALSQVAAGRVWTSEEPTPGALHSWTAPGGVVRNVGRPPAGVEVVEPTVEDGYLLLVTERHGEEVAA